MIQTQQQFKTVLAGGLMFLGPRFVEPMQIQDKKPPIQNKGRFQVDPNGKSARLRQYFIEHPMRFVSDARKALGFTHQETSSSIRCLIQSGRISFSVDERSKQRSNRRFYVGQGNK